MVIVAEQYDFVIGVDTQAASDTLALITSGTGALWQQAQFPTSPAGLRRAVGAHGSESGLHRARRRKYDDAQLSRGPR